MLPVVAPFRTGPGRSTLHGGLASGYTHLYGGGPWFFEESEARVTTRNSTGCSDPDDKYNSSIGHATKIHRRSWLSKLQASRHQLYHIQPSLSCFISINSSLQLVYNACLYTFVFDPLSHSNSRTLMCIIPPSLSIPYSSSLLIAYCLVLFSLVLSRTCHIVLGIGLIRVCIDNTYLTLWAREWMNSMCCGYI